MEPVPLVASVLFYTPVVRDLVSWCGVRQVIRALFCSLSLEHLFYVVHAENAACRVLLAAGAGLVRANVKEGLAELLYSAWFWAGFHCVGAPGAGCIAVDCRGSCTMQGCSMQGCCTLTLPSVHACCG